METPSKPNLRQPDRQAEEALAFFGVFGQPLTLLESWRWRYRSGSGDLSPPRKEGSRRYLLDRRSAGRGFFGFRSDDRSDAAVRRRWRRYRLAERKFRRARAFAAWARLLPSVRLVAVGNSLSWSNAQDESDIDLFLVTSAGALWSTRLVLGSVLMALGLRPTPTDQKDKLCLSYLVSEDGLDLSAHRIGPQDIYFTYWLAGLVPLYDAGRVLERLWQANREMLAELPEAYPRRMASRRLVRPLPGFWDSLRRIFLSLFQALEGSARRLQVKRFPEAIRELANRDSRVIVSDRALKFHVSDRREQFAEQFAERVADLNRRDA